MSGYRVRLDALRAASRGVDGLLVNVRSEPLRVGEYGPAVVGDVHLATAVDRFLGRWRTGVDLLVRDAEAVATQLRHSVHAYQGAEHAAAQAFVAGSGPDPAAPP